MSTFLCRGFLLQSSLQLVIVLLHDREGMDDKSENYESNLTELMQNHMHKKVLSLLFHSKIHT